MLLTRALPDFFRANSLVLTTQADGLYELIHDLDQDGDLTMDELIRHQLKKYDEPIDWYPLVN